ncbi:MAG TPA: murein biosynthesis integral membrane protein MurJ [Thermomicrobiales bacterium]|jgi:putative peptidoglycan lipid II flippase|nr:murein biosynthesis integral membrane protein MurJ [Thermomicrobiales bacterium]HRA32758.1 murein biosynthesis integral membrane protein MurJ [Thermomicrobiales bacterium]
MSGQPPRRQTPGRAGDTMPYPTVPPHWPDETVRFSGRSGDTDPFELAPPLDSDQPSTPIINAAPAESESHGSRGIAFAAAILMIGNILSRVLGLVREQTASYMFGAGDQMAAFIIADNVHTMLFDLVISGMMQAALIPVLSEYVGEHTRHELRRITGALLVLSVTAVGGVVALLMIFAPAAVKVMTALGGGEAARGIATVDLTIELVRWILPAVLLLAISTILMSTLFALQRFTLPSLSLSMRNVAIIFSALTLGRTALGVRSMAIGIVLGALLLVVVQLPGLRDTMPIPNFHINHPAIRRIGLLYLPIFIGLMANTFALIVDRNLAWGAGEYAPAAMRYATTLNQMVLGLVAAAISLASLPALSRHFSAGDDEAYWGTLANGLRMITVLVIPATLGLAVLSWPTVQLMFMHGETSHDAAVQILIALLIYLPGTLFAAFDQALIFAYYARKNTMTPQIVGVVAVGVYFFFALTLVGRFSMAGLVAANSAQFIFHAILMIVLLRRIFPYGTPAARRFDTPRLIRTIRTSTIVALGMAIVAGALAWLLAHRLPEPSGGAGTLLREVVIVVIPAGIGAIIYAAGLLAFDVPEMRAIQHRVLARFGR